MKRLSLFVLTLALCTYSFYQMDRMRQAQALPPKLLLLPSREMTRVMSFGNEILAAQLIFYNSMFFVGSFEKPPTPTMSRELYYALDTVTYLDPHNMDGYYFAQGTLSWNRSLIEPLNTLLRRGMTYRSWDWNIPFFYGFNQFYFLGKPKKAAKYFKRAYELNPQNTFLPTLIARLHYEADETEVAIDFLEEMIRNTTSEKLRKWMMVRLQALRFVSLLEDAVDRYQQRYNRKPQNLKMLVEGGIIKAVPPDPYGGKFYLDQSGRVRTTSQFAYAGQKSSGSGK